MVDLKKQYLNIKAEIDHAIQEVIDSSIFIKGPEVNRLEKTLSEYLKTEHCITCANGTDALQIALMALDLKPGDEVIIPAFTYVATAEIIALLNLKPVMIDVDYNTFDISIDQLAIKTTARTKAIIPVHLFGQCSNMTDILAFAQANNLYVVEDNAQSIGSHFTSSDISGMAGSFGDISTTSFYPSKNLGCYGDGGALFTKNENLAQKIRQIANHGQTATYHHEIVGCNSRLDAIQAAVLNVKLKYLDDYIDKRRVTAEKYKDELSGISEIILPFEAPYSHHIFHQFTLKVRDNKRDELKDYLKQKGIPTMVYYPIPLYLQKAYQSYVSSEFHLKNTTQLCNEVLSLPMHTELSNIEIEYITDSIISFFS